MEAWLATDMDGDGIFFPVEGSGNAESDQTKLN